MISKIAALAVVSVTLGQATAGHAAEPVAGPGRRPADVSSGLGAFMATILAPLDAATRPIDQVMRPVTGTQSYGGDATALRTAPAGQAVGTDTGGAPGHGAGLANGSNTAPRRS